MFPADDRNLLLGLLALQLNFISRETFLRAMQTWVADKSRALAEILAADRALTESERALLEIAVDKQLGNQGTAAESLAALRTAQTRSTDLDVLAQGDVNVTLARLTSLRASTAPLAPAAPAQAEAERAGRFTVLRDLARGGLGKVRVALDEELQREVALKEIQSQFAGDAGLRRRFVLEAEITGRLEHPGVVPVYGLGAYADGRPYYAMRFIKGESLREAIEKFHAADSTPARNQGERALSLRGLLSRFVAVCNAVEYAHSRGVLHRDIKPDNIMLGAYGETLVVDWGLAKLIERSEAARRTGEESLNPEAAANPAYTQVGQAIGTPAYMSPEQGRGGDTPLTPASDVYSLGVTLYSLVTGRAAFASARVDDVLAQVQAGDFPAPRHLNPRVPPALAAVCVKAMSRLPADRYGSARELADEIDKWLADEPVKAWREPWRVRSGRWLRRHRSVVVGATAAATATLIGLAVGVAVLGVFNQRLAQESRRAEENYVLAQQANSSLDAQRKRAEENFALAREAVDRYLVQVSDDPRLRVQGLETLRRDLLETAREFYQKLTTISEEDPSATGGVPQEHRHLRGEQARAYFRLAGITAELGNEVLGAEYLVRAIDILGELTAHEPHQVALQDLFVAAHNNLGLAQTRLGKFDEAMQTYKVAAQRGEELVAAHAQEAVYRSNLAATHGKLGVLHQTTNRPDLAEVEFRRACALFELLIRDAPEDAWYRSELELARLNLGLVYLESGRIEQAVAAFEASLLILRECVREQPANLEWQAKLSLCLSNQGAVYWKTGRPAEAEAAFQESIALRESLLKKHPDIASNQGDLALALLNLGLIYNSTDRAAAAEPMLARSVQLLREILANDPQVHRKRDQLAGALQILAISQEQLGRPEAARATLVEMLTLREQLASEHPEVSRYVAALAQALMNRGFEEVNSLRYSEAETSLTRALKIARDLVARQPLVLDHPELLGKVQQRIGMLRTKTKEFGEAKRALQAALLVQQPLARDHAEHPQFRHQLGHTQLSLARLHEAQGKFEPAEAAYRAAGESLFPLVREFPLLHDYRGTLGNVQSGLVLLYLQAERFLEAESEMTRLLDLSRELAERHHTPALVDELGAAQHNLGILYLSMKRPAEALASFQAAIATRATLVAEHPQVRQYKFFWAQDLVMAGFLDFEAGRDAEAGAHLQQARAALREIVELEQGQPSDGSRSMLGQVEHQWGQWLVRQDRLAEAVVAFRTAVEMREAVAKTHAGDVGHAANFAGSCQSLAYILNQQGQHDEALHWLRRARSVLETLPKETLASPAGMTPLRANIAMIGKVLSDSGKFPEALAEWNRALDFEPETGMVELRLGRAETLFRLGKYTESLSDVRRVKGPLAANWTELFARAKLLAACRPVLLNDENLPATERADLARQFDDLALEYLQFGAKAGFLEDPAHKEQLAADKTFDTLRGRDEYKKVLDDSP